MAAEEPGPVRRVPPPKRRRLDPRAAATERVIIDTDPGVDDMWALCTALSPATTELKVEGMTVCFGNNDDMQLMARNARFAAMISGCPDIPVVLGCGGPLRSPANLLSGKEVHHPNGIGGVPLPEELDGAPDEGPDAAAKFIAQKCAASPGEVTVIVLGPLTNVARALELDPKLAKNMRRVVMMGGSAGSPLGNKLPCGEANIANDPEGARTVFQSGIQIVMAGLNLTHQLDFDRLRRMVRDKNDAIRFLDAVATWYCNKLRSWGETMIPIHDSAAIIAAVRPDIFGSCKVRVGVETTGELTRGMTVCDWRGRWGLEPQTEALMEVDEEAFYEENAKRLRALPYVASQQLRDAWQKHRDQS
eukprot:TRINITY_DN17803_c0_g1_i1.p1 TRINITY_DN17803_c0_g1~~TRINITY_DN17803_c0_g1_i1.p1  ORF type:complete len:408 (+),score=135.59 TRINITY_DN17803_c0_g1_i1:142-1224(+)